jgi:hypothetical protein
MVGSLYRKRPSAPDGMSAACRIEEAHEPAAPEAPVMATIGPLLQQRRFNQAKPLLKTPLQLRTDHPHAPYHQGVLTSEEGHLEDTSPVHEA